MKQYIFVPYDPRSGGVEIHEFATPGEAARAFKRFASGSTLRATCHERLSPETGETRMFRAVSEGDLYDENGEIIGKIKGG